MGDAQQPAFRMLNLAGGGEGLDRAGKRILHDVLPVERRADHARAVAMQARAQVRHQSCQSIRIHGASLLFTRPISIDVSARPKDSRTDKYFFRESFVWRASSLTLSTHFRVEPPERRTSCNELSLSVIPSSRNAPPRTKRWHGPCLPSFAKPSPRAPLMPCSETASSSSTSS